jgi:hypothetical protein
MDQLSWPLLGRGRDWEAAKVAVLSERGGKRFGKRRQAPLADQWLGIAS